MSADELRQDVRANVIEYGRRGSNREYEVENQKPSDDRSWLVELRDQVSRFQFPPSS